MASFNGKCWICEVVGHRAKNCPSSQKKSSPGATAAATVKVKKCFSCGGEGHLKRYCPLLIEKESTATMKQQSVANETDNDTLLEFTDVEMLPQIDDDYFTEEPNEKNTEYQNYHQKKHKDTLFYERISVYPSYIDTHCHLEYLLEKYRLSSFSSLQQKFHYPLNFDGCITSFCDPSAFSSFGCCKELLEEDKVWGSFGLHPHHAKYLTPALEEKITHWLGHSKCIAVGEIGLDYSEHSLKISNKIKQKEILSHMLQYCILFNKPVVIHCRDAEEDLYDILSTSLPLDWYIHLHCYTGSKSMAENFLCSFPNLYIGLTGHLTYHKFKESHSIARNAPLDRLLIETDSPYMVPAGMKMKWSHPPMAFSVAEEISKLRNTSVSDVLTVLRENTKTIYGI